MYRVCYFIVLGMITIVYAKTCQKSYRIENNTPYTISNIQLFDHNVDHRIPPYGYIKGHADFESKQGSVLMFSADSLNFGVYIKFPKESEQFQIKIDSINTATRTVIISE